MLSTLKNAWKIPEIRKKIIFTILMLLVFRLGSAIPVPYMNKKIIASFFSGGEGGIFQLLDLISGGNMSDLSVFATGIGPKCSNQLSHILRLQLLFNS